MQITKSRTGVQQFAWRPDGKMIAFAAADEAPKKTGEEKFNDSFEVGNDDFLVKEAALPTHLWLLPAEGGEPRRLTSGAWTLPISHPPSSPGLADCVVARRPVDRIRSSGDAAFRRRRSQHAADSGCRKRAKFTRVTGRTKHEGYPVFSPDGARIAYWFPRDGQTRNVNEAYWVPAAGGEATNATRGIDRNIQRAIWMPDGKSLLVGANDGTTVACGFSRWTAAQRGGFRSGKLCPNSAFWVDVAVGRKGEIAFAGSEPQHPAELYYLPSASGPVKRLTDFNQEVAALELGKTETIEWQGPDGFPPGWRGDLSAGFRAGPQVSAGALHSWRAAIGVERSLSLRARKCWRPMDG